MTISEKEMVILSGTSNVALAEKIIDAFNEEKMRIALGGCKFTRFPDSEILVELACNVRGRDVFIIQSTSYPVNWNIMELLIMIDGIKRASGGRITAVIPYYGYARQDWKDRPRVPISARLVADMLTTAGANRVLTMDLHAEQIQGFFTIPVDNLTARPLFKVLFDELFRRMIEDSKEIRSMDDVVVVAPDVGRVKLTKRLANELGTDMAIVVKDRTSAHDVQTTGFIGDVKNKVVVMIDDIISTGGTIINAANVLKEEGGAKKIFVCCTHSVMVNSAIEKIEQSEIDMVLVTDTISPEEKTNWVFGDTERVIVGDVEPEKGERKIDQVLGEDRFKRSKKIKVISVAKLFKAAIESIHENKSVSALFYSNKIIDLVRSEVNALVDEML